MMNSMIKWVYVISAKVTNTEDMDSNTSVLGVFSDKCDAYNKFHEVLIEHYRNIDPNETEDIMDEYASFVIPSHGYIVEFTLEERELNNDEAVSIF